VGLLGKPIESRNEVILAIELPHSLVEIFKQTLPPLNIFDGE
jgi:hypothetical protein